MQLRVGQIIERVNEPRRAFLVRDRTDQVIHHRLQQPNTF